MKSEFRCDLAEQPFEKRIRNVGELIRVSCDVKSQDSRGETKEERFNGAELSESVLGRDWNSPEEDAAWSNL